MIENFDRDLFITGDPIETQLGKIRFLSVREYLQNSHHLSMISLDILHIYYQYKKMFDPSNKEALAALEELKKEKLFNFIRENKGFFESYLKILSTVIIDDNEGVSALGQIFDDEQLFLGIRRLVMDMNLISEKPVSDNPEIQEYYDNRAKLKQKEAGDQTFSDMISSVVAGTSNSFSDVMDMTIVQFYSLFYRIGIFKNFDAAIIFASVGSSEKIEPWDKHIDLFAKSDLGIKYDEFNRQYGGLFG